MCVYAWTDDWLTGSFNVFCIYFFFRYLFTRWIECFHIVLSPPAWNMIRTLLTSQITQPYWNHPPKPRPSLLIDTFVFLSEVLPLKLWPATWYVATLWWVDLQICLFGDWANISRWWRPLSHTRSPNPAPPPTRDPSTWSGQSGGWSGEYQSAMGLCASGHNTLYVLFVGLLPDAFLRHINLCYMCYPPGHDNGWEKAWLWTIWVWSNGRSSIDIP